MAAALVLATALAPPATAEDAPAASGPEVVTELTPYYTSLALYVPLDVEF
jgi:hypothetical protein